MVLKQILLTVLMLVYCAKLGKYQVNKNDLNVLAVTTGMQIKVLARSFLQWTVILLSNLPIIVRWYLWGLFADKQQLGSYSFFDKMELQHGKIWIQIIHNESLWIYFVSWLIQERSHRQKKEETMFLCNRRTAAETIKCLTRKLTRVSPVWAKLNHERNHVWDKKIGVKACMKILLVMGMKTLEQTQYGFVMSVAYAC